MPNVFSRVFVNGDAPSYDINSYLDDVFVSISEQIDKFAPEVYGSVSGAKTAFKPFIIGFIPPDVIINHVPIQRDLTQLSTVQSSNKSGTAGVTGPNELPKVQTKFSEKALGNAVYNSLVKRGVPAAKARQLTPLFVGHASAEIRRAPDGQFLTNCYNIGNVHSKGPGGGGTYYRSQDTHGSGEVATGLNPALVGKPYDTYFIGDTTLQAGVDRFVGTTAGGYSGTLNATNGKEYATGLRPDLTGGKKGYSYFTAGDSLESKEFNQYARNVQAAADRYSKNNPDPSIPDPNGTGAPPTAAAFDPGTNAGVDGDGNDSRQSPNRADIMTAGNVTDLESDDPLAVRTGRHISEAKGVRAQIVSQQVRDLQAQQEFMRRTPALALLVNPTNFNRSYEHSVDAPKARRRHIVHMWLEKPMTISSAGVTAAQYIIDSSGVGGLTNKNRVHTLSYRNLTSLVRMYKNNGYLFSSKSSGQDNEGVRMIAASVFIYYDGHAYIGSFDDLSVTDSADKPYNMAYSFKFTVRYDLEVNSVTDGNVESSLGGP